MLVELGLVEQRYKAVCEVLDGATVTDVARRNGVARQTVHTWLRRYANHGLAGLVDKDSKPASWPVGAENVIRIVDQDFRWCDPGDEDGAWRSPSSTLPSSACFSWSSSHVASKRTWPLKS